MSDIQLWKIFSQHSETPTLADDDGQRLASLLDGISELEFENRVAFFFPASEWAGHPNPFVRTAVQRLLSGLTGFRSRRLIVDALDDSDSAVRTAAVRSVGKSGSRSLSTHAVFHPRQEVRSEVIPFLMQAKSPNLAKNADLTLYLVTDPSTKPAVIKALESSSIEFLPLPLVIELFRDGDIDAAMARRFILEMDRDLLLQCFQVGDLHDEKERLRWVLNLFWDIVDDDANAQSSYLYPQGLTQFLIQNVAVRPEDWCNEYFVEICANVAQARGRWSIEFAKIIVLGMAERLPWIANRLLDPATFKSAVQVFYEYGSMRPEVDRVVVSFMLSNSCCRFPSGPLDLSVIGALIHLRRSDGFKLLLDVYTSTQIAAGFVADQRSSVALFSYCGANEERKQLIEAVLKNRRRDPVAVAVMLAVLPSNALDLIDRLTPTEATKTLGEICSMCDRPEWGFNRNKSNEMARRFRQRFFANHQFHEKPFADFLEGWLTGQWFQDAAVMIAGDPPPIDPDSDAAKQRIRFTVGTALLTEVIRESENESIAAWLSKNLSNTALANFLSIFPSCAGLSYAFEIELGTVLSTHKDATIASWGKQRLTPVAMEEDPESVSLTKLFGDTQGAALTTAETRELTHASAAKLPKVVKRLIGKRRVGVSLAISWRSDPATETERNWACMAVLASGDVPVNVASVFDRFAGDNDEPIEFATREFSFLSDMTTLGVFGLAVMWRWERAAFAFAEKWIITKDDCVAWLDIAQTIQSDALRRELIECIAKILLLFLARDRKRAEFLLTEKHIARWIDLLPTSHGKRAAKVLVRAFERKVNPDAFARLHDDAVEIIPDLPEDIQRELAAWIDSKKLGKMAVVRRKPRKATMGDLSETIAQCGDRSQLKDWLYADSPNVVFDACCRLIQLGDEGTALMVDVLQQKKSPPCSHIVAETIPLWPESSSSDLSRLIQESHRLSDSVAFYVLLSVCEADWAEKIISRTSALSKLSDLLMRDSERSFVHITDMKRLVDLLTDDQRDEYTERWTCSPHPHVYRFAIGHQISCLYRGIESAEKSLERFLDLGPFRDPKYRLRVAVELAKNENWVGFPLLLGAQLSEHQSGENQHDSPNPLDELSSGWIPPHLLVDATRSMLMAGSNKIPEQLVADFVGRHGNSTICEKASEQILHEASDDNVRQDIARRIRGDVDREGKLKRIAKAFSRGVELGRQLTGRVFKIEMIGGSDFGYTRLNQDVIYINPMPLLNGTPYAEDIVEGLILHEFGHHMYHRGGAEAEIWEEADRSGMGRLLNLVSDEHLERNLRASDEVFGNQIKRLGAYAFNRGAKDLSVDYVLQLLGKHAFDVLSKNPPKVARDIGCLHMRGGSLLLELEQRGDSFSRFFRALRLGLGNRHDDPKVAEALALFGKSFRKKSMQELYEVCLRLLEIFGESACMNREFPTHDSMVEDSDGDLIIRTNGITDSEIQKAVKRISKDKGASDEGNGTPFRIINVGEDLDFHPITTIQSLPYRRDQYAPLARQVAAPARQFGRFLRDLGLERVRVSRRTRGRQLDRSRLNDLVIRRDPRVLVSHETRCFNDLFLSVVVDCSGSMGFADNMSKAKLFSILLAEACRNLAGVDLRLFGFTDSVIYDAGTADRPAAAAFEEGGGNNDAAALWHASQVAKHSTRTAKVLIMISDGLPTECTTEALKHLVQRLSRNQDMVCAQVAVQPLEEVCFPHYVELTDDDVSVSVRRFGGLVAKLVKEIL